MPTDKENGEFITPERFATEQKRLMQPPRGRLLITSCRSGTTISDRVRKRYTDLLQLGKSEEDVLYLPDIDRQFTDSEIVVRLGQHVGGYDAFLFQSLFDPRAEKSINESYLAFLIAARTLKEHGAQHITAVLPYLAYARQDKPTKFTREPTTAKLMADLARQAGIDRLISWHPHSKQIHGFYADMPVNMLSPLNLFIRAFERFKNDAGAICVAPDVGASKFVTHVGRELGINSAIASKYRPVPEEVITTEIIGNFEKKETAIIMDDMLSSGGTIFSLAEKLVKEKGIRQIYVGVSHNLCVGKALQRLKTLHKDYGLQEILVTDSIPQTRAFAELPFVKIESLADIFSRTINRIHYSRSVSELFYES